MTYHTPITAIDRRTGATALNERRIASSRLTPRLRRGRNGDRIEIRGFGSFEIRSYRAYEGRNPRTGSAVSVKPKRLPFFKVGKELKERVNAAGLKAHAVKTAGGGGGSGGGVAKPSAPTAVAVSTAAGPTGTPSGGDTL